MSELLEGALERPPRERAAWIQRHCPEDPEVRREAEDLLAADEASERFLAEPLSPGTAALGTGRHRRLGPYRLLTRIGRGGMSSVFLAVRADDEYRQRVAVKILRHGMEQDARRRLRAERQILAALDHPFIARFLFGDTTEDGLPYFAMEYVEGLRLDEFCRQQQLSVDERLALFVKVCSAVEYAHRSLVVHRDLKPGNILVTRDGTPKLLDFGIAKLLNPELAGPEAAPTELWMRRLTPAYASPEQVRGAPISTASDVYSLGVVLYELLTGTVPFKVTGASPAEAERAILRQEPQRPSSAVLEAASAEALFGGGETSERALARRRKELHRRLSGDLNHILLKALRKEPARRYSSVERFAEDLGRHRRGEPVKARRGTLAYRTSRLLRRYRWQAAALAVFFLVVLGFAVAMASQANRIRHQAAEITRERDEARRESERRRRALSFLEEIFTEVGERASRGQEVEAVELLRLGEEMAEARPEEPELQADLLAALGRNFVRLHRFEDGKRVLRRALAIRLEALGEGALPVALTYSDLSSVEYHQGRYPDAERLARKSLASLEVLEGYDLEHLEVALRRLATILYDQQRFDEAEGAYRRILELRRRLYGDHHFKVVQGLNFLGLTLANAARYEEAETYLRQALEVQGGAEDPQEWTLAYTLNNLAFTLQEQGKLAEAEPLLLQAIAIWRRTLAQNDPQLGFALQGLGRLYLEQDKAEAAEEVFRELRQRLARSVPTEHFLHAQAESLLGAALLAQDRFDEAEPLLAGSLPVLRRERGPQHRDTLFTLTRLARLYGSTARPELAASLTPP